MVSDNISSSPLKPCRLPVFVPTSTWWKAVAKMVFTSKCSSTPSMSPVSTRCCPVIDSRQVCKMPLESPRAQWPGSTLDKTPCPPSLSCRAGSMWLRSSAEPSESFLDTWRSTSPRSRDLLFNADEFENTVAEKQFIPDGCGVKYIPSRGPQNKWWPLCSWEPWHCPLLTYTHQ